MLAGHALKGRRLEFFEGLWKLGLSEYDEMKGVAW